MKFTRLALLLAAVAWLGLGTGAAEATAAVIQQAQQRVTGQVTHNGDPLAGVLVTVKGSTARALTNATGRYEIAASPQDSLVFVLLGWGGEEVAVGGRGVVDVSLQPSAVVLEGLTVIGYQTVARERMTAAVSVVEVDNLRLTPTANPMQALQGRVAGVTVTSSGAPGAGATVRVRGISTLGNNNPLYVIDGIPTTGPAVERLNSEDIESIQVLRDAASASIYGSRASNGVIVITTKSAQTQRVSMSYSSDLTFSNYVTKPEVLNTEERGRVLWQAAINDGRNPNDLPIYKYDWGMENGKAVLRRVIIPEYVGDPAAGIRASDTRWYDESTRQGVIQDHRLSLRTAGERGGVLLSLGWHENLGIVRGTDHQQLNGRLNSNFEFFGGRLTIGDNLSITRGRTSPTPGGDENPLFAALRVQPIIPVYTESGGWAGPLGAGFDDRNHPVLWMWLNRFNRDYANQLFNSTFANFRVTPNLLATARFGIDWRDEEQVRIQPTYRAGFMSRSVNSLSNSSAKTFEWTFNSTLNYTLRRGAHTATMLGGVEALKSNLSNRSTYREGFALEERFYFVESAGTGPMTVSGTGGGYSLLSQFGKVDYDFDDTYLASFTIRRDGSSRFGSDNPYGIFPAFALAWRLSNESFFPLPRFFNDLKLRFSWGKTGNQQISNTAALTLYAPNYGDNTNPSRSTAYDIFGTDTGTLPSGFRRTQTGNPRLRWEETAESNYGVDFGLLDSRITGAIDYFDRTTSDILIQPTVLGVIGEGAQYWFNGATMRTTGGELSLDYQDELGDLRVAVSTNVGHFDDRITFLPPDVIGSYPGNVERTILGRSVNSLFGYVADGIFQNKEEVDAHAAQPGKGIGRIRYRDLNNDKVINALDQDFHGDTNPSIEYGVNTSLGYGNFDFSFFVQGVGGRKVNNTNRSNTDFPGVWPGANWSRAVLNAWTPDNRDAEIPAVSLSNVNNETRASTYFFEDGDYLKVRELVIGYRLPSLPGLSVMEGSRIYARVGNLWTIALGETTLLDPEFGFSEYSAPRNITIGINADF